MEIHKKIPIINFAIVALMVTVLAIADPYNYGKAIGSQIVVSILFSIIFFKRLVSIGLPGGVFLFASCSLIIFLTDFIVKALAPNEATLLFGVASGLTYCYFYSKTLDS